MCGISYDYSRRGKDKAREKRAFSEERGEKIEDDHNASLHLMTASLQSHQYSWLLCEQERTHTLHLIMKNQSNFV